MSAVDDLQDPRHFSEPELDPAKWLKKIAALPSARRPPAQFLIEAIAEAHGGPEPLTWDAALAAWRVAHPRATEQPILAAGDDLEAAKLAATVHVEGVEGFHYELGCVTRPSPEATYVRLALQDAWRSGLIDAGIPVTKDDAAAVLKITSGAMNAGLESCRKRSLVEPVKGEKHTWLITREGRAACGLER